MHPEERFESDDRSLRRKAISYAVGMAVEISAVLLLCLAALTAMGLAMLLAR